jgi:ribosomal-protein-alanine N-acetyltransferase
MTSLPAEMKIRRMTAADLGRVMEIAWSLAAAPHWPLAAYQGVLSPEGSPQRIALVAEAPETRAVAGFAVASLLAPQAELESIAVAAESQRRGLARRLVAALAADLRPARIMEVVLEVRVSNLPALALYRALGFTESGRRPRYYSDPVEDAVLMRLGIK